MNQEFMPGQASESGIEAARYLQEAIKSYAEPGDGDKHQLAFRNLCLAGINVLEVKGQRPSAENMNKVLVGFNFSAAKWLDTQRVIYSQIEARHPLTTELPENHQELLVMLESGEYYHDLNKN